MTLQFREIGANDLSLHAKSGYPWCSLRLNLALSSPICSSQLPCLQEELLALPCSAWLCTTKRLTPKFARPLWFTCTSSYSFSKADTSFDDLLSWFYLCQWCSQKLNK
uniref:Uncharacterized protein n=1 Tax=Rhipicephalus microplus TaxID=6941 RepID=A0A6G5AI44_RHIMP